MPTTHDPAEEPSPGAGATRPLAMVPAACCVCARRDAEPVGVGEDFEYRTSPDSFLAVRCTRCGVVYLDRRPDTSELPVVYPDSYHAFAFTEAHFGLVHRVRRRLEARRLLRACRGLPSGARILDVGCGDGFHLKLLRDFGDASWRLEGVDADPRAIAAARAAGLTVHCDRLEACDLPRGTYDFAFLIQTVEHLDAPRDVLARVGTLLRPGGRLLVVTDNTGTLDFRLWKGRHWGGYHFPRHWYLFDRRSLGLLARAAGLTVESIATIVSPVNWTYSIRNALDDWGAPRWLVRRFTLASPVALAFFTGFDALHRLAGRGALLRAVLRRPVEMAAAR